MVISVRRNLSTSGIILMKKESRIIIKQLLPDCSDRSDSQVISGGHNF
jgi:hypothetical protein